MKYSIDNINIQGSLKYRLMFVAGAIIHLCFLAMFLRLGVIALSVFNVFSVLLYAFGSLFSVSKRTGQMRFGWMIAFYSEIMLHMVACMLIIGEEANFYLYAIAILPIAIYVLFFSCSIQVFFRTVVIFVIAAIALIAGSLITVNCIDGCPYFPLTYDEIYMLRLVNMVFTAFMLIVFSMLFSLEVYSLLKKLRKANRDLEYTATHDALTGLYNRHSLKSVYGEVMGECGSLCVALGDVDDFKKINDTYGHDCGDAALKTIAEIMLGSVSEGEIACRWGGEEILLILRGCREDCLARLERIQDKVRGTEMSHEGRAVKLTMTFGFADGAEEDSFDKLISSVDKRLYRGKKDGKNRIVS